MKPYKNLRTEELGEYPDKADSMYRKSSMTNKGRGCRNKEGKAQARRNLKRQDRTAHDLQEYRDSKDKE